MTQLNSQQLAFILDIKKEDARAKMVRAYEKSKGIELRDNIEVATANWSEKGKVKDEHPAFMKIEILAAGLNIPDLQKMVDDICLNYLNRPASKKYILVDYPEKWIKKCETEGKEFPVRINIPPALKSMLPDETVNTIHNYWKGFRTHDLQPRFRI